MYLGKTTNARQGKQLTCVWCRAQWVTTSVSSFSSGSASGRLVGDEGYINVANVPGSGVSPVRDTSTCEYSFISFGFVRPCRSVAEYLIIDYYGRRRGRGYGYPDYH
jgi:hypothetical protein